MVGSRSVEAFRFLFAFIRPWYYRDSVGGGSLEDKLDKLVSGEQPKTTRGNPRVQIMRAHILLYSRLFA
jgi:hypothetical protein